MIGRSSVWTLACSLLLAIPCPAAPTNSRPNLIIILADDLGFSDLSCFGSEISTPNLDRMAAGGLRMNQFYTTPRCCPSRAALLTGLYPQQAGIGNMMEDRGLPGYRGELNKNCLTIAEELRRANYHTAMVGKWHQSHIAFDGKQQLNGESDAPFWDNQNGWPLQRGSKTFNDPAVPRVVNNQTVECRDLRAGMLVQHRANALGLSVAGRDGKCGQRLVP